MVVGRFGVAGGRMVFVVTGNRGQLCLKNQEALDALAAAAGVIATRQFGPVLF